MRVSREWFLLLGALLVVAALYNHYLGHSVLFFEIVLLCVGSGIALFALRYSEAKRRLEYETGLLSRFIARFVPEKWLKSLIPIFGLVLLVSWSAWKLAHNGETNLRMEDIIVTLFSVSLLLYHTGPSRFQMEKDFAVLYLLFLTIVFAVIWKLYVIITGESISDVTAHSEYYFITMPVVLLVRLVGVDAEAELDFTGIGYSNIIEFFYEGHLVRLGIGTGCSGLYSAGLFFSAFLAFVLVRYARIDWRIMSALGLGFFLTWASNILRMAVTVVVGAAYGPQALATFHMYFGVLLFVALIAIFWIFVVRWLDKHVPHREMPVSEGPDVGGPETEEPKLAPKTQAGTAHA